MEKDILLTSTKLANGIEVANRFVLSPMATNSSTKEGYITKEDIDYAKRRAHSAPLQVTGAAYINKEGQLFEYGFSIDSDDCVEGLKEMAQAMKSKGAKIVLQLTHAGRFSTHYFKTTGHSYGTSPMKLHSPVEHEVREMTIERIKDTINDYKLATKRAILAGFDGIEISSAQRLLPQEFFSSFSNKRQDEYGCGSLENRARFVLELFEEVYKVIKEEAPKDFILGYRATPEETRGADIGYTVEEFNQLTDWLLEKVPLDYLAIASWGENIYLNKVRSQGKDYGRLINEVVHEHLAGRIPLMATGGINSIEKAHEAIKHAEMVGLSTPFIADPEFVEKFESGDEEKIQLNITLEDIEDLAIPEAAFKDISVLMDLGKGLPQKTRDELRRLEKNYNE